MIIRVVARNRFEFKRFCEIFSVPPSDARYITCSDQIRGVERKSLIFYVNDCHLIKDFGLLKEIALSRNLKAVEVKYDF